eukprot:m.93152 g.93152  ORF g.93152 m.93152 type:complete len:602 (+) comp21763_c0_seq2:162-1967(+)
MLLLDQGEDASAMDENGQTPLHCARSARIAELLIQHGCSASTLDKNGRTPLHCAQSVEIAKLLLAHGCSASTLDKEGKTPLHCARSAEIAELLLEHGCNPSARDKDGRTPVHCARATEVAELLRKYNPDTSATEMRRSAALHPSRMPNVIKKWNPSLICNFFDGNLTDASKKIIQEKQLGGTQLLELDRMQLMNMGFSDSEVTSFFSIMKPNFAQPLVESNFKPNNLVLCPTHGDALRFLCRDCNELACGSCFQLEHKSHISEKLQEAIPKKKAILEQVIADLPSWKEGYKAAIAQLEENLRKMEMNREESLSFIQIQEDKIINHIQAIMNALRKQVMDKTSKVLEDVSQAKKVLKTNEKTFAEAERKANATRNEAGQMVAFTQAVLDIERSQQAVKNQAKEIPALDLVKLDTLQTRIRQGALSVWMVFHDDMKKLLPLQEQWMTVFDRTGFFKARLIWRASRDGWEREKFLAVAKAWPNTLTLIKIQSNGKIFGCFTSVSWGTGRGITKDIKAFLVCLNDKGLKIMPAVEGGGYQIYSHPSYGVYVGSSLFYALQGGGSCGYIYDNKGGKDFQFEGMWHDKLGVNSGSCVFEETEVFALE